MRDVQDFERRLAEGLEAVAGPRLSVDAAVIARAAITRAGPRSSLGRVADRVALPATWRRPAPALRWALVMVALAALVIAAVAGLGNRTSVAPDSFPACPGHVSERDVRDATAAGDGSAAGWRTTSQALPKDAIAAFALDVPDVPDVPMAVVLVDATTGAACRLIDFTTLYGLHAAASLSWSPTGSALAIAVESHLFVWADGELLLVWRNEDPAASPTYPQIAWAPDGSAIAVSAPLRVYYADGSPTRDLGVEGVHPRWSPDGSTLSVERQLNVAETVISLIDVATAATSELTLGTPDSLSVIGWLDDTTLLVRAFAAVDGTSRLFTVPIDSPADATTSPAEGPGLALYAPDLSKVALLLEPETTFGSELTIVDRDTGAGRVVAEAVGPVETWMSLAWAPDSSQLAFTTVAGNDPLASALWVVGAAGGEPRLLIDHQLLLYPGGWRTAPG